MKNSLGQLLSISLAFTLLSACSNDKSGETQDSDSYSEVGIPGDTTNKGISGVDTTNFRDGVPLNEGFERDTLQLPQPILQAIDKDNNLKNARVGQKTRTEVNGATLYEIVFYEANGNEQRVTFDSNGKRQSIQ